MWSATYVYVCLRALQSVFFVRDITFTLPSVRLILNMQGHAKSNDDDTIYVLLARL